MTHDKSIQTQVDEALDETFPASDPPSYMAKPGTKVKEKPLPKEEREAVESDLRERRREAKEEATGCGCAGKRK